MKQSYLQHLFGLLFFSLPFSYPFLLWSKSTLGDGQFSVWSAFFLQVQDFILFAILLIGMFFVINHKIIQFPKLPQRLLLVLSLCIIPFLFAKDQVLHVFVWLQFVLTVIAFSFMQSFSFSWKLLGKYFVYSMLFVSLIASLQIILQQSIGFYFLGEAHIAQNILGVAKIDLGDSVLIRAYGTFLHPNILAFFSIIAFYIAQRVGIQKIKWIFLLPLFISFSRAAWVVFILSYFLFQKKISKKEIMLFFSFSGLFLAFFSQAVLARLNIFDAALSERLAGVKQSILMFLEYPFGVGLHNFTLFAQKFSSNFLFPWDVQPVHNLYLLILNEGGVLFFIPLIWFFIEVWKRSQVWQKQILFACFSLGIFDHYLWTSYNAFLLFLIILLSFYFQKEKN